MLINLSNLNLFNTKQIALLNEFIKVNKSLMPHAIAVAVGCRLEDSITLLLFLYGKTLVTGYLLVYHKAHPDFFIYKRDIKDGLPLPSKSYLCPVCDGEEISNDDLLFDFEFLINDILIFEGQ